MIDERTPHRQLPLPHPDNRLSADVPRLRAALTGIDTALHQLQQQAGGAAPADHGHAVADIDGLTGQLANINSAIGAIADDISALAQVVDGKQASLVSGESLKTVNGQSLLGAGNLQVQSWQSAVSTSADDGTDLMPGRRYTVESGTSRYLPDSPAVGDTVALLDPHGLFAGGTWTLRRRNTSHAIGGVTADVPFDYPAGIVTVEYAANNQWVIA